MNETTRIARGDAAPAASSPSACACDVTCTCVFPTDMFFLDLVQLEATGRHDDAFATVLAELEREEQRIARRQAKRARLLAFLQHSTLERARIEQPGVDEAKVWAMRERTAEIATALQQSEGTIAREMAEASTLVNQFPTVHDAYAAGRISMRHVRSITGPGERITDDTMRFGYEQTMLAAAKCTPSQLKKRATREVDRLLSETIEDRHKEARKRRGVRLVEADDGMCEVQAYVPIVLGKAIVDRLTEQAKALKADDEPRSFDELVADVFCDTLLTSDPTAESSGSPHGAAGGIRPRIMITVPVLTLLGRDDAPALLDGVTPISLDDARELAAIAPSFTRVLTDPATGVPLSVDTRFATKAQHDFLRVRDKHCRFPGCRRQVLRDELDHTIAWADGGATSLDNLGHLCVFHHTMKHHSRWKVRQLRPGDLEWTSPGGRSYTDRPEPAGPAFTPADAARLTSPIEHAAAPAPEPEPEVAPDPAPDLSDRVDDPAPF